MNKKRILILALLFLLIFVIPIPTGVYKDGGTREYSALIYKIVDWKRQTEDGVYDHRKVYLFPRSMMSIDKLWQCEEDNVENKFIATILEITETSVVVEPVEGESELLSSDRISFNITELEKFEFEVGSVVEVTYVGGIMESYPSKISAIACKTTDNLRHLEYTETWLDKTDREKHNDNIFDHVIITRIYSNCFFATPVIPMPYQIKLNGNLPEQWCVGDQILCTYENTYYNPQRNRVEADFLSAEASDWQPDPYACYKPVIYLYPIEQMEVLVKLKLNGEFSCTYPAYDDGWNVTAFPDGTLIDKKGQSYNYLYWEGITNAKYDFTKGWCVKGEDTALFLESALNSLGLTRREANEFIVYWLPLMEDNPYNLISFQTEAYTDSAELSIEPSPDTLIRVFMTWKASERYQELNPQKITAPIRNGFTVVEWGGTEIK